MTARIIDAVRPRIIPAVTDANRAFWTGGSRGQLLIQYCDGCRRWRHPPADACPGCASAVEARPVSGRATILTFTENHQQFHPDVPPPYVIAVVTLVEQDDLRIPTNIVQYDPDLLGCGTEVEVLFERNGSVYVPLFEPVSTAAGLRPDATGRHVGGASTAAQTFSEQ